MKEYLIDDLNNKRFIFDKQPPRTINYFLIIVLLVTSILIYLSLTNKKIEVVKVDGVLQAEDKSLVVNKYPGEIIKVNVNEGSFVNKGDIIVEINSNDIEKVQLVKNIEYLSNRIQLYEKLQENLKNKTNSFNSNDLIEQEFYYKVEKYFIECSEYEVNKSYLENLGYDEVQINEQVRIYDIRKRFFFLDNYNSATNEKNTLQNQVLQYQSQLEAMETKEINIIANKTGIIHLNPKLKNGMYIEAGQEIASISQESTKQNFVIMIPSKDRSVVKVGNKVDILIDGLSQQEYGTLRGTIKSIDIDSSVSYDEKIYFKGEILLDNNYLLNSKNEKINISSGITGTARIQYKSKSYFKYFLDILGIEI